MKQKRPYNIILHTQAAKELKKIPKKNRQEIREKIDSLAHDPFPMGAAKLKGSANAYRLRAGDYRIVYEVNVTEIIVYIFGVMHRKEVYMRILRRM